MVYTVCVSLNSANAVFNKIMEYIIFISPLGIFCLMCNVVAVNGLSILSSMLIVVLITYLEFFMQFLIVYFPSVQFLSETSFLKFIKYMSPAMIFAFSSSSSLATLPISKKCIENLGVDSKYSSFILPLGATINMDGAAIYMSIVSIFIASCYGVNCDFITLINICLATLLASIGSAGITGSAVIILTLVLQTAGIPLEGIALVYGIDKLFDMGRTLLNITGDATCAVAVSNLD